MIGSMGLGRPCCLLGFMQILIFNFLRDIGENLAQRSWLVDSSYSRCQKSYHRDNWLVAAKRSQRHCFLILRCRLFLTLCCRIYRVQGCSSSKREPELGLDNRETDQFDSRQILLCLLIYDFFLFFLVTSNNNSFKIYEKFLCTYL